MRNVNQLRNQNRVAIALGVVVGLSIISTILPEKEKETSFAAEQKEMIRDIKASSCDMRISMARIHEGTEKGKEMEESAKEDGCYNLSTYR